MPAVRGKTHIVGDFRYGIIRWYDPITGRWLSKDPIGIAGGLNQYVFCDNNPFNFRDPFGLWAAEGLVKNFAKGFVVGAFVTAGVVIAAVVIVAAVPAGATAATVGIVSVVMLGAGGYGLYNTAETVGSAAGAGDYDTLAYVAGNITGSALVAGASSGFVRNVMDPAPASGTELSNALNYSRWRTIPEAFMKGPTAPSAGFSNAGAGIYIANQIGGPVDGPATRDDCK